MVSHHWSPVKLQNTLGRYLRSDLGGTRKSGLSASSYDFGYQSKCTLFGYAFGATKSD